MSGHVDVALNEVVQILVKTACRRTQNIFTTYLLTTDHPLNRNKIQLHLQITNNHYSTYHHQPTTIQLTTIQPTNRKDFRYHKSG